MDIKKLDLFNQKDVVAWVGAGGKSTLIFSLAKAFFSKCVISTSTHLAETQSNWADHYTILQSIDQISKINFKDFQGTYLLTENKLKEDPVKLAGLRQEFMDLLVENCKSYGIPLFIEADGSKNKPFKAPALHEPAIPKNVTKVCVVAGLSAVGKPINSDYVHRPEIVAKLVKKSPTELLTLDDFFQILTSDIGGLKSIPAEAEKYLFLNQSDLIEDIECVYELALRCKNKFSHVLITYYDDKTNNTHFVADFSPVGCILLAAGESIRFGTPKQLAKWYNKTFLETIIDTISKTTLNPIIVVTGAYQSLLNPIISKYENIINVVNNKFQDGQSGSVSLGIEKIQKSVEAVIFLMVDQPQISVEMINHMLIEYARTKSVIIAYSFKNKTRHPVLFSKMAFNDLLSVKGDSGGRQLFKKYPPSIIPIENSFYAMDFDTQEELANFFDQNRGS